MATAICAAGSALEVVTRREDDVTLGVQVGVFVFGNGSLCFGEDGFKVIDFPGDPGDRFEAGTA